MTDFTAIIIENRGIPGLNEIIAGHEKFLPAGTDIWHIKNEQINSMNDYNRLLTSKRLWSNLPENVLIFQHDSRLLRTGIEEFLQWSYVGAPIPKIGFPAQNGGLSLRCSSAMIKVIDSIPYTGVNEDVWFCNGLYQLGLNIAPYEVAERFSCETQYKLGTVGFHQISSYLSPNECNTIISQYG